MGKAKVEKVNANDGESNQKFSLKFITMDEKTTHEMAGLGYNHLLDLTVKKSNKWSSVLVHLGKKWSKVPQLNERITIFFNDINGNSSVNLAETFANHSVWDSLSLHPTSLQNRQLSPNSNKVADADNFASFIVYYSFANADDVRVKTNGSKKSKDKIITTSNTPKMKKNEESKAKNKITKTEIVNQDFKIVKEPVKVIDVPKSNSKIKLNTSSSTNISIEKLSNNDHNKNKNNTNDNISSKSNVDRGVGKKSSKINKEKNWCDGNSLLDAVFMVDSNLYSNQVIGTDQNVKSKTNDITYECSKQMLEPNVDTNILNLLCNMSNIGDKTSKTMIESATFGVSKNVRLAENIHTSKSKIALNNIDNKNNDKSDVKENIIITKTDDKAIRLFEFIEKKEVHETGDIPILKESSPSPCTVTLMSTPPENKSNKKRSLSEQTTANNIILKVNNKKMKLQKFQSNDQNIPANHIFTIVPSRLGNKIHPPSSKPHKKRIRPTFLGPLTTIDG